MTLGLHVSNDCWLQVVTAKAMKMAVNKSNDWWLQVVKITAMTMAVNKSNDWWLQVVKATAMTMAVNKSNDWWLQVVKAKAMTLGLLGEIGMMKLKDSWFEQTSWTQLLVVTLMFGYLKGMNKEKQVSTSKKEMEYQQTLHIYDVYFRI